MDPADLPADWRKNCLYCNSAFLFTPGTNTVQVYRKKHLVPFGEYLPFDKTFTVLQRWAPIGFSCSPGREMTVFELGAGEAGARGEPMRFSVLICFEDVFPYLAREAVQAGARFLVNQTNDAWFDGSHAHVQHMSHCVFRCVENRVPAVRCANSGVSCFIDTIGYIEDEEVLERTGWGLGLQGFKVSRLRVPPGDKGPTFYARHGDLPFAAPCGWLAGALFLLVVVKEKLDHSAKRRSRRRENAHDSTPEG
jgi:apolipoprotein N-acyltransferase